MRGRGVERERRNRRGEVGEEEDDEERRRRNRRGSGYRMQLTIEGTNGGFGSMTGRSLILVVTESAANTNMPTNTCPI